MNQKSEGGDGLPLPYGRGFVSVSRGSEVHLRIIGMTCGGCVQRVETALRRVPGAGEPVVNLLAETATVPLREEADRKALIEAVRAAGYDAEIVAGGRQVVDRMASDADSRETLRRHRQGLIQAVGLALPIMALDHGMHVLWGHAFDRQLTARYMQLILLVMLGLSPGAAPIIAGGLRSLVKRVGNMDLLVTMGVLTAFASSVWGVFVARDPAFIHIDAAAMILALVCVGRYLEARAKARAAAAMRSLAKHAPRTALVRRDGEWKPTPVERIEIGDEIAVPEYEPVPVDGDVVEGPAAVDESLMTGEAMPVQRGVGDRVLGGSMVTQGRIVIRATATGARSTLGRIMELVYKSQTSTTPAQRMADRLAGVFVPIVLAIAVATLAGWLALRGLSTASSAVRSAAAVLVVACPCALGLATPTVVMVAMGRAALRGILVRDAATLEAAGRVATVVWDKTGTLTAGRPSLARMTVSPGHDENELLRVAAGAEQFSSHPLAKAVVAEARQRGIAIPDAQEFRVVAGSGVIATIDGKKIAVGKSTGETSGEREFANLEPRRAPASPSPQPSPVEGEGVSARFAWEQEATTRENEPMTTVGVWINDERVGSMEFRDAIRPSAREAVERLRGLGIENAMLTGDSRAAALAVAREAGIDESRVFAEVMPEAKVRHIRSLRSGNSRVSKAGQESIHARSGARRIAMVGDGINDAPALAAADVGIAFAAGAQLASDAAGIQLIGSTPMLVADAVALARAARRIIRQNLFWAFFYNVLMIPLAATGRLSPAWAAGAMMISSLTVVLNALRLRFGKSTTRTQS